MRLLGNRSQAEVKNHIRQAAMLIAPSIISADGDRDGLPTILVEAMALGTPCISTNIVGIPELVRDGDTGLLAPPNDPPALADTIARLLNDPALAARALIERDYNIHHNTAQLREHIRASIAGQK